MSLPSSKKSSSSSSDNNSLCLDGSSVAADINSSFAMSSLKNSSNLVAIAYVKQNYKFTQHVKSERNNFFGLTSAH